MMRLRIGRGSPSIGAVKARRSLSALVAALLALVAIFSMNAVSGWHASAVQDDVELAHSLSADHDHDHGKSNDTDSLVHLAAHCLGHSVGLPGQFTAPARSVAEARVWAIPRAATLKGQMSPSVLRPPEA